MEKRDEGSAFMAGIDRLTGVLNQAAEELDGLAESLAVSDAEIEELNAGKTAEEIAEEDALVAEISAPIVRALDSMSAILNEASAEMCGMTAEQVEDCKEAEI